MDHFLSQLDFQRWAETSESKGSLPHVVRLLVDSTVKGNREVDFPAYEAGNRPGFDGVVVCSDETHRWVPCGRSVWELGAGDNVRGKATEDLEKRSDLENTPREVQEQSFFVFVTPRRTSRSPAVRDIGNGTLCGRRSSVLTTRGRPFIREYSRGRAEVFEYFETACSRNVGISWCFWIRTRSSFIWRHESLR